jgi:exodeoxyribonuclease VII large subunit
MDMVDTHALTVSHYASLLVGAVRAVGPATLEGEVQKPKASASGMLWFTLTDGDASLSCKVFRGQVGALQHTPRDGDLVRVDIDRPDFWPQAGRLDLIASQIRLAGEGELLRRRQELVARLRAEGLCDPQRRRPLSRFPRAVGVIAGEGSDAIADVIQALSDRWPASPIVLCPSLVQGKRAPAQLIDSLARLQEHGLVDAIVMARGGGSVQDLACFDDERLCRAIFACAVPVVCAVGHTQNNPVCNHVAWAAYTPSRSAEMLVPSAIEVRTHIAHASERLRAAQQRLDSGALVVQTAGTRLRRANVLDAPAALLGERASSIRNAGAVLEAIAGGVRERSSRLGVGSRRQLDDHSRDYCNAIARLLRDSRRGFDRRSAHVGDAVAGQAALLHERVHRHLRNATRSADHAAALVAAHDLRGRGWLLATSNGAPLRSAADLSAGARIELQIHDGAALALVESVHHNTESDAHD